MYVIILILILLVLLVGCALGGLEAGTESETESMFIEIERRYDWYVVYHRDTKVMYTVSTGSYNRGTFTLMVDLDGNPLLYEGE